MNIFRPTTFTWWQISALKFAVFFIGIAIGANWPELFRPHIVPFLIIGLVLSVYVAIIWSRNKE